MRALVSAQYIYHLIVSKIQSRWNAPLIAKEATLFFWCKNFFIRRFRLKFAKIIRTYSEHARGSEKNNESFFFFTAFTFLNPEILNYIIMSSIRWRVKFCSSKHSYCAWSMIHLLLLKLRTFVGTFLGWNCTENKNVPGSNRKMDVLIIKKKCMPCYLSYFSS